MMPVLEEMGFGVEDFGGDTFLVSLFNLGEHGLVDVEGLVDDMDGFTGLFLVPFLELGNDTFVDIIAPIIHFEDVLAVLGTSQQKGRKGQ